MGHSSTTNYTVSQSITTEQNGDSIVNGLLPSNVVLTITPNAGFTVDAADFNISGISADSVSTVTSTSITNLATGNFLSHKHYNFLNSIAGGNASTLSSEVLNVVIYNSEFDYDATANVFVPVTTSNVVYVYVYFINSFTMPSSDLTLNIDLDGVANSTNAIQYPAVLETWTSYTDGNYTISKTINPNLFNGNLFTSVGGSGNTEITNVSGLVDDQVQTLLMTITYACNSGFYFDNFLELEQFTIYGLVDWLPYFDVVHTVTTLNSSGQLTLKTIEYYYTNPPLGGSLDPTFGGNNYGLGWLYEYQVSTLADTPGGGISPLKPDSSLSFKVATTSSEELGNEVEKPKGITSTRDLTFFKEVKNVVFDTEKEINALGGETRSVTVYGDKDAGYFIRIVEGSNTYDPTDDTFTSTATQINGTVGSEGFTIHNIVFPPSTSTKSYVLTIGGRFGTKLPATIVDGESGNIGTLAATATRTFTLAFTFAFTDATCDYNNDPTIAHDDDNGKIEAGMFVTGTGIPSGATVASITSDTAFELSASTTGGNVANGTLTFNEIAESMPANLVFSFSELNERTASNTFKASINGDNAQIFAAVSGVEESPDATSVAAMAVSSGSANGWEWNMTGFNIVNNGTNSETNKPNLSIRGTITVQTLGGADVAYAMALDSIINVS